MLRWNWGLKIETKIKRIVEKINRDNIFKIVDHVFDLLEDIDIIFWLGSGFVNYIWNNNYYTWTNFCEKEYRYLKIQDFFTLTQIDFDYPNQINEINDQAKKEDFKQNGFKKLVKQIHQTLYYKNGNDSQIYGNSRISFITTNHCKSIEGYFGINNVYYLKDILRDSNDPISNFNCFYLHSYSDNYHGWIYKIEHYKKMLDSGELNKVFNFFRNKFNKRKIIFCFGNSLNEVHLVSTLSEMNSNEKSFIVNIRIIKFAECKNEEKINEYCTHLNENLSKFNENMMRLPDSKIINLYLTQYDDADNIWNILRHQFEKHAKKLDNFNIDSFYGGITESSIIKNELNNYKNLIVNKEDVQLKLNFFLKVKHNKILEEIWNHFNNHDATVGWFFSNIDKFKFLKNIDINRIISLWWWCSFEHKNNHKIFNLISTFVFANKIKELDINRRGEVEISTLIEHLSLTDNLPDHLIELIVNSILKIFWNSWSFGCAFIFHKEKYLEILSNTLKSNKNHVINCIYLKLEEFNLDNKSIGKTLFVFESLSRLNLITMKDILKILDINLRSMILQIYYKDIMGYISKYFYDNQDKFKNELTQSYNDDKYQEKLYLSMKYNISLKNENIKIFNEFNKKYKDSELIDNNKFYSRTAGSNLKPNDDDKEIIDNWKLYDNLDDILKSIIVRSQESWEKEDALVYLFRKFKLDNNYYDWDTVKDFFTIIQSSDEYLKCLNNYSTFFSIIINEAYHNLLKEYQLEVINAIDFKVILECFNKFEKYKIGNYSLNLFEFEYKDLNQLIYFIEIAYEVNCYILIKSILSDFACVHGYPIIFTIFTSISKRKFTLFQIFRKLYEKNLLLQVINNIWGNNIYNQHINNICSDVLDDELFLFKMIYTEEKWDKGKIKENFNNIYIKLTAEYFYKLDIKEEQYFYYINHAYHSFLNFVLWIYNKNEISKLIFIDSNIDFLKRHNNMYELFIQLIIFSEQDNALGENERAFIDKWRESIIISFFQEIEKISYFIEKRIFDIAKLLNNNIFSKIDDTIFTKISDKLINEIYTTKDFYKQNKYIDNLLLIGVLSFNKIQNKLPISNTYLYRFFNKNKSNLKLNKESINILKKKLWDYK